MDRQPVRQWDVDLRIPIGHMTLNVLYLSYEPPVPGWSYSHHCHSSYELHYIPAGYGTLKVGNDHYRIVPGSIYVTGPGVYHEQLADADEPMSEFCMNVEFKRSKRKQRKDDAYIRDEIEALVERFNRTAFWIGPDSMACMPLCTAVMTELDGLMLGRYAMVQNLIAQMMIRTIRSFSNPDSTAYTLPRKIPNDSRRLSVDNYFIHLPPHPSPAELAALIGVSVRQLERILRQYYGGTFTQKMIQSRIECAKTLLAQTDLPLRTISERAGFSSLAYMHRRFKAAVGDTPGGYRASMTLNKS